jgi:HAD superfamily hydrolase (TIGR01549 family)
MKKAIIFDLDGTLIDLPVNWEALFDRLKQIMHTENVRPLTITVAQTDPQTRKKVLAAWDEAELAVTKKVVENEKGMKIYHENVDKTKALVTMQGKKATDVILGLINLKFDSVITREDSLSREKQLSIALEKLKVPAQDSLFVGDADSDATAARKKGLKFQRIE